MGSARRAFGLVLAMLLAVGVVVAVVVTRADSGGTSGPGKVTTVRGVVGSEKVPFFADPEVVAAFKKAGYRVDVDAAGSRDIANHVNLSQYDFAFPAGSPQGDKIAKDRHVARTYAPFFSPMAIATFKPIAALLVRAGLARPAGAYYLFDVGQYLKLVERGERWSQLPGNTAYQTDKSLLISSTDVRTSNSAAMYLALMSYAANGDGIVTDAATADRVASRLAPIFLKQGYVEASTQEPFDDYLTIGVGKTPMTMIYEAQYLARAAARDGSITPDMVLMYPTPTTFAKHTLVPLNAKGDAIGRLLSTDPTLRHLAVRYGFRTSDVAYFRQYAKDHGVGPPPDLVNVVEPPTFDLLETMISKIDALYKKGPS